MSYINLNLPNNDLELNPIIDSFCKSNNINEYDVKRISESDMSKNITISKFNQIVNYYGIKEPYDYELKEVNIKDIIGFEPNKKEKDIISLLNVFYSNSTETYRIRDNNKLKLGKERMIEELRKSFTVERIILDQIDDKYVVSQNGCHRVSILKFLFIDEVLKENNQLEQIDQKYKIQARVNKYDLTLTYINYFLNNMGVINHIDKDYDNNFKDTGKFIVYYSDGQNKLLTRDELIKNFSDLLNQNESNINDDILNNVNRLSKSISSFNSFLKEYAPTLIKENEYGSLN